MDVKELEARIAKFEAQQAASDSARQAAETKAAEAEHARRDAQAKYEAAEVARKAAEEETKKHSTEAAERIAKLEADKRANEIEKLADSCKIPALRGFVKQFAELGHAAGGVKLYDAEKKEQTPQAAVESFIKYANENAAKLFKVVSSHEEIIPEDDNPAAEVDKRVKEFMAKNAGKNYTEARTAVLAADPDLKERYAAPRVA